MSAAKWNVRNFPAIAAQAMTGNITSQISNIEKLDNITYQYVWSGSATGTFNVEVSNNVTLDSQGKPVAGTGTWEIVPISSGAAASGSSGDGIIELSEMSVSWVRTNYVFTSGSGTLDVYFSAKSEG